MALSKGPYSHPTEDEFVHHEIANNFDSFEDSSHVVYESEFDQLNECTPTDIYVNEGENVVYDDTPTDPDCGRGNRERESRIGRLSYRCLC